MDVVRAMLAMSFYSLVWGISTPVVYGQDLHSASARPASTRRATAPDEFLKQQLIKEQTLLEHEEKGLALLKEAVKKAEIRSGKAAITIGYGALALLAGIPFDIYYKKHAIVKVMAMLINGAGLLMGGAGVVTAAISESELEQLRLDIKRVETTISEKRNFLNTLSTALDNP